MALVHRTKKVPYRRWPVTVALSDCDDEGNVTKTLHRFVGFFLPLNEQEIIVIREEVFGKGTDEELAERVKARTTAEQAALESKFAQRVMCGWIGVTDEDGTAIDYSSEVLDAMLTGEDGPAFRSAVGRAILELRLGLAPAKNVLTSPESGPAPAAGEAATS